MSRAFPLLLALVSLAGCLDLAADEPPVATTVPSPSAAAATCTETTEQFLEWKSPEGSEGARGEQNFTVRPETRELSIAYTPPTAAAGSYALVILAPNGSTRFEDRVENGVRTPGSSVQVGGSSSGGSSVQNPPPPGEYVFTYEVEGAMQGASLVVSATGCW